MEAKIDKRTNAYKKGLAAMKAETIAKIEENITNPEAGVYDEKMCPPGTVYPPTIENPEIAVEVAPVLEATPTSESVAPSPDAVVAAIKLLESVGATVTPPPQATDEPPIPVKADLLHCPGCGTELLEDERNLKGPAYCRKCIWKDA